MLGSDHSCPSVESSAAAPAIASEDVTGIRMYSLTITNMINVNISRLVVESHLYWTAVDAAQSIQLYSSLERDKYRRADKWSYHDWYLGNLGMDGGKKCCHAWHRGHLGIDWDKFVMSHNPVSVFPGWCLK